MAALPYPGEKNKDTATFYPTDEDLSVGARGWSTSHGDY